MALLTPLSLADAQRLGALYGVDVAAVRGIPAGSVNSSYELALAGGGRVFLRVYEEQRAEAASGEAALLDHLSARGVATPRPIGRADGSGFIAEHAGKPVAVFPWASGETLCQARVTPFAARRVGEALARVHLAGADFSGARPSRFGVGALAARLDALRDLPPALRDLVPELRGRLARARPDGPPGAGRGIIHGDLFRDNVLWADAERGELTALLDFESASTGLFAFDLMVTVLAWCFGDGFDAALAGAMTAGYAGVRPLSTEDRAALHEQAMLAALRFTITRITDFELRPAGSGVYKDYRRFLARLVALEEMGPEGLSTLLGG